MDWFQYFHLCNHQFNILNTEPQIRTIDIENSGGIIDILIERARILDIIDIKVKDYPAGQTSLPFDYDNLDEQNFEDEDVQDGYFDSDSQFIVDYRQHFTLENGVLVAQSLPKTYYSLYLNNRVKWNVKPPVAYVVTVSLMFTNSQSQIYKLHDCPRCQGNGWYVDLFDNESVFKKASGIHLVAQRYIKDLFTQFGSNLLDIQYGTTLTKDIASSNWDDVTLHTLIRSVVSETTDNYLARQAAIYNELSTDERLVTVTVSRLNRLSASTQVIADLIIQTESEAQNLRIPILGGG